MKIIFGILNLLCSGYFFYAIKTGGHSSNLKNNVVKISIGLEILCNILPTGAARVLRMLTGISLSDYLGNYTMVPTTLDAAICGLYYAAVLIKRKKKSSIAAENSKTSNMNSSKIKEESNMAGHGRLVYVPDKIKGYTLGKIVDIGSDTLAVELMKAAYNDVVAAEEDQCKDVDDNCNLMYLNEGTLLNNCKLRYLRKQIYTYLYGEQMISKYEGKSLGALPPTYLLLLTRHIETCAASNRANQYLCQCWGSAAGPVEQRILEISSSRWVCVALLARKTRVCHQHMGERNFHVFYQLFVGDDQLAKALQLTNPDHFHYLKNGCTQYFASMKSNKQILNERRSKECQSAGTLVDSMVDDHADFYRLSKALLDIGLNERERDDLFKTLAGILHLGNVVFHDNLDDSKAATGPYIQNDAADQGRRCEGYSYHGASQTQEAIAARDALAKAIYSRLFDHIIGHINQSIPLKAGVQSVSFIGVLDIAGFEFFGSNSFEQFCINYCNEKLQHFFNDRILRQEQELYVKEALNVPHIQFTDNQDCIDLFEAKTIGLLDSLDEESRLPRSSSQHFTLTVLQNYPKSSRLARPRKSTTKSYREMRDEEGFIVSHYAGDVCYETALFLEKNNDALHVSLEMLLEDSNNSFMKRVYSFSSKFRSQLRLLIQKLTQTGTHFVRCIKPNSEMKPGYFQGAQILDQLKCAGMTSVLKLMQKGFPSRTMFEELYGMYQKALPLNLLDWMLACFARPGKFAEFDQLMKQDAAEMRRLIEKVQTWILRLRWRKAQYGAWSCVKLKNKILYRAHHLVKIQSGLRGHIARTKHRPRMLAFQKTNCLINSSKNIWK
uniref:Myosin motor domain-containing protein n=1 Tax=Ditylenchus dipsaci TaxID=166011 RepID=A0A915E368_9BILA